MPGSALGAPDVTRASFYDREDSDQAPDKGGDWEWTDTGCTQGPLRRWRVTWALSQGRRREGLGRRARLAPKMWKRHSHWPVLGAGRNVDSVPRAMGGPSAEERDLASSHRGKWSHDRHGDTPGRQLQEPQAHATQLGCRCRNEKAVQRETQGLKTEWPRGRRVERRRTTHPGQDHQEAAVWVCWGAGRV